MAATRALVIDNLLATVGAPTVTPQGASGATTYGYKVVAKTALGNTAIASAEGSTASGNATLDGTNFNRVTWTDVAGAAGYDIYRTTGGATQGKIGEVAQGVQTFDDTGLVGDEATEPATNSSGTGTPSDVLHYENHTVQISGTFVGQVVIEGSIDRVEFQPVSPMLAAGALVHLEQLTLNFIRVRHVAYTSGQVEAYWAGHARG